MRSGLDLHCAESDYSRLIAVDFNNSTSLRYLLALSPQAAYDDRIIVDHTSNDSVLALPFQEYEGCGFFPVPGIKML